MISKSHQTLPAWTYTSDAFLELEKRYLFLNNWQLICHSSNIPNAGDYFTFNFFNERLVAIRNERNDINVFHNVCSHRATRLLEDDGNCGKRIRCPYHAWSYDLSGNLKSVPHEEQFKNFDKEDHNLKPVQMEIFLGFIFAKINPSSAPSVADQFNPYLEDRHGLCRRTLRWSVPRAGAGARLRGARCLRRLRGVPACGTLRRVRRVRCGARCRIRRDAQRRAWRRASARHG